MTAQTLYTMKQACEQTGMTYEGLKYYCNQGLVPNVKRDANNHRVFDEHDIEWINTLGCLRRCNLSIQEMKVYMNLCLEGASTIPKRQAMLARKRVQLEAQMQELQESLDYLDWKQQYYQDILAGKKECKSNLTQASNESKR